MTPLRLLVGFDGSAPSGRAVEQAGILAATLSARLTVLCVAESLEEEADLPGRLARVRTLLRERGVAPVVLVRTGEAAAELSATVREVGYDLVIVGGAGTWGGGLRLPATTWRVLRSVAPPVLVVKGERPALRRILLATGGLWTEGLERAIPLVTGRIAAPAGAEVVLFSVVVPTPPMFAREAGEETRAEGILAGGSALGAHLRRAKRLAQRAGVPVRVRVAAGDVVDSILREAEAIDADLVVIGSAPPRGLVGFHVLGDVGREVLDAADRPVLILHTFESRPWGERWGRALRRCGGKRDGSGHGKDAGLR